MASCSKEVSTESSYRGIQSVDEYKTLVAQNIHPFNQVSDELLEQFADELVFLDNELIGSRGETIYKIFESLNMREAIKFNELLYKENIEIQLNQDVKIKFKDFEKGFNNDNLKYDGEKELIGSRVVMLGYFAGFPNAQPCPKGGGSCAMN